ncbi:MAG: aminotransferase class IV [Prolixibacteraceae bacterium]|nr:aminotransferase class IV [Prolixibacteraceae bacterium]
MFRLVESICIENRSLQLIDLHNKRMAEAMAQLFGISGQLSLQTVIKIPENLHNDRYKCRLTWNPAEGFRYTIMPYQQRSIHSLKLITVENIEYFYKTDQRHMLDEAYSLRAGCDDILIVKNQCLTDAWSSNILLFNGEQWLTPDTPLLKGVQRRSLLESGKIKEARILATDIFKFQKIKLVNAMVNFERAQEIPIGQVIC